MDKRRVMEKIIIRLTEDLELLRKAARDAHAEATHESSKAENKYDTRGLEASYLADGQVRQAVETEETIAQIQALPVADLMPGTLVAIGALVELESKGDLRFYFVASRGGGVAVEVDGAEVVVITPQAPLGQLLIGRKANDCFKMGQGRDVVEYRIQSVR